MRQSTAVLSISLAGSRGGRRLQRNERSGVVAFATESAERSAALHHAARLSGGQPLEYRDHERRASIRNRLRSLRRAACKNLHPDFGTTYDGAPNGIPYTVVHAGQAKVPVKFDYADESDPGPYPIPPSAPIEGGANSTGDRHVLVLDVDAWKLYELYDAHPVNGGASWTAGSGAVFDLNSNALRPAGWTSADAAGLPIFPGLVRYDEAVEQGAINHALRFTCPRTRAAYVAPARHYASNDTSSALPAMGMRVRLKANFDTTGFTPTVRVILRAMMRYGMFVADNGSGWFVSGAPDPRWSDDELSALARVPSSAFEVVK